MEDPGRLQGAYREYMEAVLASPLWSEEQAGGVRIPWRLARDASNSAPLCEAFGHPGLSLFASAAGIPLYWGMTEKTLWQYLSRRFVHGPKTQCQLTADYERDAIARGLEGFPDEVRQWYRRITNGTVRLRHAVAFAQHGIEGIWFTVLPVREAEKIKGLKSHVIDAAGTWNQRHEFPPLLNWR